MNSIPEFIPSSALLGRLAALSRSLRPYKYLDVEGSGQSLVSDPLSPERAQLLITLLNANFHTKSIDSFGVVFDYADLSNTTLKDTLIENKSLNYANFEDSDLSFSSLKNSFLSGASFINADLSGTDFTSARLPKITAFKNTTLTSFSDFNRAAVNEMWMTEACTNEKNIYQYFCDNWKVVPYVRTLTRNSAGTNRNTVDLDSTKTGAKKSYFLVRKEARSLP